MRSRVGLVLVAGLAVAPVATAVEGDGASRAYVNNTRSQDGERRPTVVWDSELAQRDCLETALGRIQRLLQALYAGERSPYSGSDAALPEACADAQVADLVHGTEVILMSPSGECGSLTKIRVASGRHKDRIGCVVADRLATERVP